MRALRPVGNRIPVFSPGATGTLDLTASGAYQVRFTASGTAALGLALSYARKLNGSRETALIPAYGCPDLVAAASFAGLKTSFVDLQANSPWLAPDIGEQRLGTAAALVGVNFLGMRERLETLRGIAHGAGIPMIEDSAQMMPFAAGSAPSGDLVVYSFGRGKPLALSGGGALLVRSDWWEDFERRLPVVRSAKSSRPWDPLKRMAYNLAVGPWVYAWIRRLSFLKIGEVAYYPLESVEPPDEDLAARLERAFRHAAKTPNAVQSLLAARLAALRNLVDLPGAIGCGHFPLLRYPVLARDRPTRDRLVAELDRAGLGASPFYGIALTRFRGLPAVSPQEAPNAERFAERLFTLPVHDDVRPADVEQMAVILEKA